MNLKVLHRIDTFLTMTENWVYPQVLRVSGVESRVVCREIANPDSFPIAPPPWTAPPPWRQARGAAGLINSVAARLGRRDFVTGRAARRWGAQILHAHFGTEGWQSLPLRRRLRIPLATSFYGYDAWRMPRMHPIWRRRYLELFAAGSVFLVEGGAMRRRLEALGCPGAKIRVHRIGVDLAALPFRPRDFDRGLRVAMIGRFVEKKGMVDGLTACALARSQGTDLTVTIVGDAATGDADSLRIKDRLQDLAIRPELAGRVRFTGLLPLAQIPGLLQEHNLLLCPSRMAGNGDAEGGSPVILTEAMASGLLCLGTRHCDIPEVILDQRTGLLSDEGDLPGLAACLKKAAGEPAQSSALARAGRNHVEENFSLDRQLVRLRHLYDELLAPSPA